MAKKYKELENKCKIFKRNQKNYEKRAKIVEIINNF